MTIIDREWQDGDDSALQDEAFQDGRLSMHADMRLMYNDLRSALWEEMEVHEEPSLHLVESVGSWALRLHELGFMSDEDKTHYFEMTNMEEDDD